MNFEFPARMLSVVDIIAYMRQGRNVRKTPLILPQGEIYSILKRVFKPLAVVLQIQN